jgi:REP element-mobilizing transposase RayT
MARPLRIEYPDAVYHVTSRGNDRRNIFRQIPDRVRFLDTLDRVNDRYNWICHAYCLMGNHYHLLIETPDGNLSLGMRQLNGIYTQSFNKRYRKSGHVFQGRYNGDSAPNRPPIPIQIGHPIRLKSATDSEANRPGIPIQTGHPLEG